MTSLEKRLDIAANRLFFQLLLGMFILALVIMVLGMLASVALFALKAGLLRVPHDIQYHSWRPERAWLWAASWAAGITLLGFFGALAFAFLIGEWPAISRAYVAWYGQGISECGLRFSRGGLLLECIFGTAWNVVKADALPFFVASTILLYSRAACLHARRHDKSIWAFLIPALVGAGVFLISMHISLWLSILGTLGLPALVQHVADTVMHEILAPFEFLKALFGANQQYTIGDWFRDEIVRMNGSFYKTASLYPKALFVLLVGGLAHYALSSQ